MLLVKIDVITPTCRSLKLLEGILAFKINVECDKSLKIEVL